MTKKPILPIAQLFKDDPIYQKLSPKIQQSVDAAIHEELEGIAQDFNLLPVQKEQYRKHFLEMRVPRFLKNMLHGQEALEKCLANETQEARRPLDHATRESDEKMR